MAKAEGEDLITQAEAARIRGVRRFTAVVNPPQAAILAVGALEQRPVVRDGQIVAGHVMSLTLCSDHRILYGADAAAFLADIRAGLEEPMRLLV